MDTTRRGPSTMLFANIACAQIGVISRFLADGSMIKGKVTDSVICRSVRIEEGAEVDGCVILQNAIIRKGAKLSNVIVDKGVSVDEDVVVQCPKQYPLVFEKKKYFASVD